ncbi:eukaryotic translation initiation factor 4E-like isoform X2 [Bolinopsis microptera]|uniref:eukaryotic translation initiation factor 4E-like isoform X2 n=1 Tax=Bolinopsis microptera TaxID=2820187 RepID=UPI00307996D8
MAAIEVEKAAAVEILASAEEKVVEAPKKHPLENAWTLWFFKEEKDKDWIECYKKVASFTTVEDFWALYNFIMPPSKLAVKCEYSVFKEGIQPMWEDKRNLKGGRWVYAAQKTMSLDKQWMEMLMSMAGEQFDEYSNEVNGVVLQRRARNDRLAIWVADTNNLNSVQSIGLKFKNTLGLPSNINIHYESHADAQTKASSHKFSLKL